MDLPEYRRIRNQEGLRISAEDIACVQLQGEEFVKHFGADEDWFLHGFYLDYSDIGRQNLKREQVERWAADALARCRHIRRVWTRTELEGPPTGDRFEKLYRDSYYPDRSPDLLIQHEKYFLPASGTGTTHGSPYDYDAHVPMVFLIPGTGPSRVDKRVATADIAPTLADVLGIDAPEGVDGRSLKSYFAPPVQGQE
jgi:arylsulfatase A-like enzyme